MKKTSSKFSPWVRILCIALAAYAIYRYLKKDKNLEQIVSLWNRKWGKESIQAIKQ